jgi:hypothetical protein
VAYPFKFGTYKGTLGTGRAVQIRVRKATCDQRRQYLVRVKGACLRILKLEAPSANCPDGTSVAPVLDSYLVDKEIHLPRSGSYSDHAGIGIGGGTGLQQSDTSVKCATAAATFTATL